MNQQKMTWEEMKKAYPDEWLLIVEYETDQFGGVKAGVVVRHSKDDQEVFRLPAINKDCAFRYTGECQFPGGLRAHAEHNHF
ncbi:MAG: hypothetical protein Q8P84_05975 [Deltaproteobacteria bacterium]|nr:hypothetical protein [Deltaproteobacteria bacterium]